MLTPWKESYDQPRQLIKKQRHYFANKGPSGQGYGFSGGHVWIWELDCEESWAPKNWCFWTVVLEKTLESPLDCKEVQPVHPKGDQPWVFIGRTDTEAETPVRWPPHSKSWLIGKDPDAGRDWGQEEEGMTEDEMAGWHLLYYPFLNLGFSVVNNLEPCYLKCCLLLKFDKWWWLQLPFFLETLLKNNFKWYQEIFLHIREKMSGYWI